MKINLEYSEQQRCFHYNEGTRLHPALQYMTIAEDVEEQVAITFTRRFFSRQCFPELSEVRMQWLIFANLENNL
jgi:hypothetical protein